MNPQSLPQRSCGIQCKFKAEEEIQLKQGGCREAEETPAGYIMFH